MTAPDSTWVNRFTPRVMLQIPLYRPYSKLKSVRAPVLVLAAVNDETTPSSPAVRAAERTANVELIRLPRGHFDPYVGAQFEEVVAAQTEFLARHLL
jgi:pimeloyl-ACP methyl ester carboxylesterase